MVYVFLPRPIREVFILGILSVCFDLIFEMVEVRKFDKTSNCEPLVLFELTYTRFKIFFFDIS